MSPTTARSIFLAHVVTLKDGRVDASGILSKRCFDEWVRTRRKPPDNAPQSFRNALKTVLVGSHRVLPFPAEVEAALLLRLREEKRWPCFEETNVHIGVRGWKLRCFHEAKGHNIGSKRGSSVSSGGSSSCSVSSRLSGSSVSSSGSNSNGSGGSSVGSSVGSSGSSVISLSGSGNKSVCSISSSGSGSESVSRDSTVSTESCSRSSTLASASVPAEATPPPSPPSSPPPSPVSPPPSPPLLSPEVAPSNGLLLETRLTTEIQSVDAVARPRDGSRSSRKRPKRTVADGPPAVEEAHVLGPVAADAAYDTFESLCALPESAFAYHAKVVPQLLLPKVAARFRDLLARNDLRLRKDFICPVQSCFVPLQPVHGMVTVYKNDCMPAVCTSCEEGVKNLFGANIVGRLINWSEVPVYHAFVMAKFVEHGVPERVFYGDGFWGHIILRREAGPPCIVRYRQKLLRYTAGGFSVMGIQVQDVSHFFPTELPSMFPELLPN